uniref:Nucleotide-diphospho-sugar transferase domain-containing protein n=1 Tax=Pelagomonas calceolata TaxID=35677 RepID=A0A7S4E9R4_9STRA
MRALLLLALAHAEPSISAITPINNGEVTLQDGALVMAYAVADATDDLRLCTQLTNKRVSFESHTHCVEARAPVTSFKLGGFLPGVWRCRAVLRRGPDPPTLHRGAAPLNGVVSNVEETWFLVEKQRWLADVTGEGPNVTAARRVLELASADETLRKALQDTAIDDMLVVTMANLPHADLALNLAFSAARAGAPLFAFALSDSTYDKLRTHNVACGKLPTLFGSVDGRKDVQSAGFSEIAVLKPVAVVVALRASIQVVWWLDTDVVLLRDLPLSDAAFAIQAGGLHARDYAINEDQFHAEQCTGVFRVTREAEMLLVQSALELATIRDKHPERTWAGDQAASNLVLHERRFREGTNISVEVLDPLEVPGGGLFFDGPLHDDRGPLIRADPVLAHNNFLVGAEKKLQRFRAHGMWYADFVGAFDDALLHRAPLDSCASIEVMGITPEVRSIDDVLFVEGRTVLHLHSTCSLKDRVVAVASLGDRPWVSSLIKRVAAYSIKVDADLLVAGDASQCYTHEEGDNGCAKAFKLIVRTQRLLHASRRRRL